MSLRLRRILFYLYVGLFLILAPLLVFYTAGYRFNFVTGSFVQTGAVSITTIPKGATIYFDNQPVGSTSPKILQHILPGNYHLSLKKSGYRNWERDIEVKSRETMMIENAVLFLETDPELILPLNAVSVSVAPDNATIAYATYEQGWIELWLYSLSTNSYTLLDRFSAGTIDTPELSWQEPGSTLEFIFEKSSGIEKRYYTTQGALSAEPLVTTAFSLEATPDGFVAVQNADKKTIAILPSHDYRILSFQSQTLLLKDENQDEIILIDPYTDGPQILLQTQATFQHWNNGLFYYGDGIELHRYDPKENKDQLLTRSGALIKDIVFFPNGTTVFLVRETYLEAIDFADVGHPMQTSLFSADVLQAFWTDDRGRSGYFIGTKNGETGLFQIRLTR